MPMSVAANYAMKQYGVQDPKQAVAVLTEDIFGGMEQPQMETQQQMCHLVNLGFND